MLQALKPLLAFTILLFSVAASAQNDAKAIIKSIPVSKVKTVESVPENDDWYYFRTKTQVGLWDNTNKKVLVDLKDNLKIHNTNHDNIYIAHGSDYWGVVLISEQASYLAPENGFGLDHDSTFFENRYNVTYEDRSKHMYYSDSLLKLNFNMTMDEKFILVNQRDWTVNKEINLVIRRADNKTVENYEGWVSKFNGGYKVSMGYNEVFDIYDTDFKAVLKNQLQKDMGLAEYNKIIPFEIDSISGAGYQELLFYSGGKIGMFSWYDGVVMKPEYDMAMTAGYYYTVIVKDGKLGLHVNMGGKVLEAEHDVLEVVSPEGCEEYIRVGDRLFEAIYYDCEIFDHLQEVNFSRYDSVASNNIKSSCTIVNGGADMIYNHNVMEYKSIKVSEEVGADGFEDETYGDRRVYTRKSGIYNFAKKSWAPEHRYHSIIPFGDNFYVITEPAKNIQQCKIFITDKNFKRNDVYIYEHQKTFNGRMICIDADKNYYWYSADGKRNHIGKFKNLETQEQHGYLLIGQEDYDMSTWESIFYTEAIIGPNMKELKADYPVSKIVGSDLGIVSNLDEFGDGGYGIIDLKTGKIVEGWFEYITYANGMLTMGNYEGEEIQIAPATLRSKL